MIKKEYERLLQLLNRAVGDQSVPLEDILKEAVVFFEVLRKEFPAAQKEEREEMVQMMTDLHERLQQISKLTARASGMTEDELAAYSENPSNFTPEQWQLVQSTKRQLYDSARKFSASVEEKEGKKVPEGEKPKKAMRPKTRRSRRKEWKKT